MSTKAERLAGLRSKLTLTLRERQTIREAISVQLEQGRRLAELESICEGRRLEIKDAIARLEATDGEEN